MNHMRGLVSTAQALRRTFLSPLSTTRVGISQPFFVHHGFQLREFQYSRSLAAYHTPTPPAKAIIKDEDIRARRVQLVNAEGDLEPHTEELEDVLKSFDRREFFLLQVAPGAPRKPPVCKIMNKLEYRNNEKAKEKAAKAAKKTQKQIELNWAIDAHDLAHRLKQLTTFLEKGCKVEIILLRKKQKRPPTVEEIKHVMQSVLDTVREAGGTQVKAMEGEPGKRVLLIVKKVQN